MHDLQRHALIVVVASAFVLSQSTQSPAGESTGLTGRAYFYCSSEPSGPVVYFSDFFVTDSGARVTTQHNAPPGQDPSIKIQDEFFAYLKHKYSFKSNSNYPTGCPSFGGGASGLTLAKDSKKNLISQYTQAGKKIVETGWKYAH